MTRFSRLVRILLVLLCTVLIGACGASDDSAEQSTPVARKVLTEPLRLIADAQPRLSGTVRARFETPMAFQVGGRIAVRHVDAGQRVEAGAVLFELDPRDLIQAVRVAEADLSAAEAERNTAAAETRRSRELLEREFISPQAFEQIELVEQAAHEAVDAAAARVEQARNALDYAELTAPSAGTLLQASGEPGQVVAAGQAVATLALYGQTEIEVFLPEALGQPERAALLRNGQSVAELELREVAGAADPQTRTWTTRYRLLESDVALRLGAVVQVRFGLDGAQQPTFRVPIGALDERGFGPRVWLIEDGRAVARPIEVLSLDHETASIAGALEAGLEVIALGTHLLEDGQAVEPLR